LDFWCVVPVAGLLKEAGPETPLRFSFGMRDDVMWREARSGMAGGQAVLI